MEGEAPAELHAQEFAHEEWQRFVTTPAKYGHVQRTIISSAAPACTS